MNRAAVCEDNTEIFESACHGHMMKCAAGIFSARDLSVGFICRENRNEIALCSCRNAHGKMDVAVRPLRFFNDEIGFGDGNCVGNGTREC